MSTGHTTWFKRLFAHYRHEKRMYTNKSINFFHLFDQFSLCVSTMNLYVRRIFVNLALTNLSKRSSGTKVLPIVLHIS